MTESGLSTGRESVSDPFRGAPGRRTPDGRTTSIQCLVRSPAEEIDGGEAGPEPQPILVRQNRWRACRFGLGADLVDPLTL